MSSSGPPSSESGSTARPKVCPEFRGGRRSTRGIRPRPRSRLRSRSDRSRRRFRSPRRRRCLGCRPRSCAAGCAEVGGRAETRRGGPVEFVGVDPTIRRVGQEDLADGGLRRPTGRRRCQGRLLRMWCRSDPAGSGRSVLAAVRRRANLVAGPRFRRVDVEAEGADEGAVARVLVDAIVAVGDVDVAGVDGNRLGTVEGAVLGVVGVVGHRSPHPRGSLLRRCRPGTDPWVGSRC